MVNQMPRRSVFQVMVVIAAASLVVSCASSTPTPSASALPSRLPATSVPTVATPTPGAVPTIASTAATTIEPQLASRIDSFLASLAAQDRFSGSVLVAKDRQVILSQGYNMADRDRAVPNTPQTVFRLGSLTKQFTAMAILQLQQMGKLDVQDPICQYIIECPETWQPITIHHLLVHTSGIPNLTALPTYHEFKKQPATPNETIDQFRELPLDFMPGENWAYSNSGYIVLGAIVEAASDEPYCDYVEKHIAQPLQMANTGCESNRPATADRAQGYADSDTIADTIDMSIPFSGGGLISTVEDMFRWDQALYGTELLSQPLLDKLFMPMAQIGVAGAYGYGWFIGERFNQPRIWHGGGIEGFRSQIDRYPDRHATIIVLSNREDVNAQDITSLMARMILEDE